MLYVTTRSKADAFTVHRALTEARGSDAGQYLPMRNPVFPPDRIAAMKDQSFGEIAADILNQLFATKLSRWDVEFAVGRNPVRTRELGHRILAGECWHNPKGEAQRCVDGLVSLLREEKISAPGEWVEIAAWICMLFGLYGRMLRCENMEPGEELDISAVSGEFTVPMAAHYARAWGLPIGSIICCCNENNEIWNLICQGQLRTDAVAVETATPDADIAIPVCLERLIHSCGGAAEVETFLDCCRRGANYYPCDRVLQNLRNGLFVSVISSQRLKKTVSGVWGTHRYLMDPYCAMAYAGLLDYRAKKGQLRRSIVISERSPKHFAAYIAESLGIPEAELNQYL